MSIDDKIWYRNINRGFEFQIFNKALKYGDSNIIRSAMDNNIRLSMFELRNAFQQIT